MPTLHVYRMMLRINLSTHPPAKDMLSRINKIYRNMTSTNGELRLVSGPISVNITTKRKLDEEEEIELKNALHKVANQANAILESLEYTGTKYIPNTNLKSLRFRP